MNAQRTTSAPLPSVMIEQVGAHVAAFSPANINQALVWARRAANGQPRPRTPLYLQRPHSLKTDYRR